MTRSVPSWIPVSWKGDRGSCAKPEPRSPGIVPFDTVKRVHKNIIRDTLPREHLVLSQTPQVFRFDLLKRAVRGGRIRQFHGRMKPVWWSGWKSMLP